ncbi:MAG: tetratricopeptide repeat protein [Candidatus Dactylopiibacterium sp.]|nr:tetratricopeptide repeat protein [Candidatus Dactylopiibacterium sp.]
MDPLTRARALFMQALAAQEQGDLPAAESLLREALRWAPTRASLRVNLASVLIARGRIVEARATCAALLADDSTLAEAWLNLSICDLRDDAPDAALAAITHALACAPASDAVHANHGNILMLLGRHDEALAAFDRALALSPSDPNWHVSRGTALRMLERLDEAAAAQQAALRIAPGLGDAHWNLALVELARGHFDAGWRGFEWRWRTSDPLPVFYTGPAPRWQGEALAGRRLLLWAEQGLGDTLQFFRFAQRLAGRGERVLVQVQPPLVRLLRGQTPGLEIVGRDEVLPAHDLHLPLLSLPGVLGAAAADVGPPACIAPVAAGVARWHGGGAARPRIGLMWQGNLENRAGRGRSVPAALMAPLLALPAGFVFIGKAADAADLALLGASGDFTDRSREIADFADTAAQMAALDLVVTIDTSVAHLAASMALPCWVLLAKGADWRWGAPGATQSPWYPQARLFRQQAAGDWAGVLARVHAALAAWLSART